MTPSDGTRADIGFDVNLLQYVYPEYMGIPAIDKPIEVLASGVAQVATGSNHSLFLKEDGSLWASGKNDLGQLGTGDR